MRSVKIDNLAYPTDEQMRQLAAFDSGRWSWTWLNRNLAESGNDEALKLTPPEAAAAGQALHEADWLSKDGEITFLGRSAMERWAIARAERLKEPY